jgi:hypothetical protein
MKPKALTPDQLKHITQRHERDKSHRTKYSFRPATRPESDRAELLAHVAHLQALLDERPPVGE